MKIKIFFSFNLAIALLISILIPEGVAFANEAEGDTQMFRISAYYSPLPDQEHYLTGSYESEIRLNGSGVNGADGTPVYPGMIAAPSKYPFGYKMYIPGIGTVAVHDRGGAIVEAGERSNEHDRLDVWMGYGEAGLARALNWGKRNVLVTTYGINSSIKENVYLENFTQAELLVKNRFLPPRLFKKDIWYQQEGPEVESLQKYLKQLGYYDNGVTGYYDIHTLDAVFHFQKDQDLVNSLADLGAGHTGINTRRALDNAIAKLKKGDKSETAAFKDPDLTDQFDDLRETVFVFSQNLSRGDRGEGVLKLQDELQRFGYLRIEPTGYFGETTEHAVYKFQQAMGLVDSIETPGAGTIGPNTRATLNRIISQRLDTKHMIAIKRVEQEEEPVLVASAAPVIPAAEEEEIVTEETAEESEKELIAANIPRTELDPGEKGEEVSKLQQALQELGYYDNSITGYFGNQTKSAVLKFQIENSIVTDEYSHGAGRLGPSTLRALANLLS